MNGQSLPAQWTTEAVGHLFEIQLGKMLSKKSKAGTSPFPYLANRHVQWGEVDTTELEWMDFNDAERKKFSLRPGDLLVCEGGEVGRTAIWRGEVENCYFQKAVHRLRPKDGRVLPEYMYRFMERAAREGLFRQLTSQTSIAHLTKEKLAQLEMPLPPLPEQRRIATILDKADAIRRKRQETIRLTEEFLRSAFLDMFGDPVTNPKGWPTTTVAEIAAPEKYACTGGPFGSQLTTAYYVKSPGVPVIRGANLGGPGGEFLEDGFVFVSEEKAKELARNMAHPGDVIFTQRGTLGQVAKIPEASCFKKYVVSQSQMKLTVNPSTMTADYVVHYFRSDPVLRQIERRTLATGVPHINLSILKGFPINSPPLDEQNRFVALLDQHRQHASKAMLAVDTARELFSALVSAAFRGDI